VNANNTRAPEYSDASLEDPEEIDRDALRLIHMMPGKGLKEVEVRCRRVLEILALLREKRELDKNLPQSARPKLIST
jgi:hypothetical protein